MRALGIAGLISLMALSACSTAQKNVASAVMGPRPLIHAMITISHDDARIGSYVSSWNGFRTSSYWIEGPDGLILIDTQFLLSAAEEFVDDAEKITGKKAKLAIVLHPNPDKFNGTALFQKRGIPVVTSEQVLDLIPAVHKLRMGWFYNRFKPDYPSEEPRPQSFGTISRNITAAGITVRAHVMGPGCSGAHVVVEYDGHFFVGDLVTQGFHSWLELGLLDDWLDRLDEIQEMNPKFIHTGRGGSGGPELIDREIQYLETVIKIVKAHHPKRGVKPTQNQLDAVQTEIEALYPSYDFPLFVSNGLKAVWNQQSE